MPIWPTTNTQLVSIVADIHGRKYTSPHCYARDSHMANITAMAADRGRRCRNNRLSINTKLLSVSRGKSSLRVAFVKEITPREETVAALFRFLLKQRAVHIRGTPTSGKSVLSELLRVYIEQRKYLNDVELDEDSQILYEIIYMSWSDPPDNLRHPRWIYHICSFIGFEVVSPVDFMARSDVIVIIDEAQLSYSNIPFWLECVKNQAAKNTVGPRFVMFASYGSASTHAFTLLGSSITLEPQQRVSLTIQPQSGHDFALCFSIDEVEDVCRRFSSDSAGVPRFQFHPDVVEHLYMLTNGHPGLITGLLRTIIELDIST